MTAFTIIASLEVAGRLKGATGLFDWIGALPWRDPFFASVALSMIAFVYGGFGGAVNAAYAMNAMVRIRAVPATGDRHRPLGLWDRFGLWTALAVLLVVAAYAYPLATVLAHPRYGSPPFQPF